MKVLFSDVPQKKLIILKKMADSLKIEMKVLQDNEDTAINQAMEEGKNYGRMSAEESDDFLEWLNAN